ncbi:hypothetical protein B2J93_9438 [Marssonina coronariae]|uniref:Uncharacterized protein n=1 Tax=Diplocarpon coronariae TaxID=2795749 RepID=A0A218YWF9_9HELO|nr:hypothetical protein B2J93_9438 [Marssonina coronariae]
MTPFVRVRPLDAHVTRRSTDADGRRVIPPGLPSAEVILSHHVHHDGERIRTRESSPWQRETCLAYQYRVLGLRWWQGGGGRGAMERDETTHAPCSALVFDWWEKIHCLTARSRRSEKRHHVDRRRQGARQAAARGETAVETPSVEGAAAQIRDLWPAAQSLSLDISQPDNGQRRRSSSGEMPARVEVTG